MSNNLLYCNFFGINCPNYVATNTAYYRPFFEIVQILTTFLDMTSKMHYTILWLSILLLKLVQYLGIILYLMLNSDTIMHLLLYSASEKKCKFRVSKQTILKAFITTLRDNQFGLLYIEVLRTICMIHIWEKKILILKLLKNISKLQRKKSTFHYLEMSTDLW